LPGTVDSYRIDHSARLAFGKRNVSRGKILVNDAHGIALRMTGIRAGISGDKQIENLKSKFASVAEHESRASATAITGRPGMTKDKMPRRQSTWLVPVSPKWRARTAVQC